MGSCGGEEKRFAAIQKVDGALNIDLVVLLFSVFCGVRGVECASMYHFVHPHVQTDMLINFRNPS